MHIAAIPNLTGKYGCLEVRGILRGEDAAHFHALRPGRCVPDFAFWSSFSTSSLMRSAFSSSFIARAPSTIMIAPIELVLAASSIISPMSLKRAPDFTRVLMGRYPPARRRLLPTSSVVGFDFASLMLVTTLGSWLAFATTSS